MSTLVDYIMSEDIKEKRANTKFTLCHRPGGTWGAAEVSRLVTNLKPMTEAVQLPSNPEYLVLYGHYTKDQMKHAGGAGLAWTVEQCMGIEKLPFNPFQ